MLKPQMQLMPVNETRRRDGMTRTRDGSAHSRDALTHAVQTEADA